MATVVLADDDELVRYALVRLMESEGHTVLEANNGIQAEAILERETVDILVTDIIMPEQEGMETLIKVRANHADLPIIVISGGGRDQNSIYLNAASELGADEVFAKPISDDIFIAAVNKLAASGRPTE